MAKAQIKAVDFGKKVYFAATPPPPPPQKTQQNIHYNVATYFSLTENCLYMQLKPDIRSVSFTKFIF